MVVRGKWQANDLRPSGLRVKVKVLWACRVEISGRRELGGMFPDILRSFSLFPCFHHTPRLRAYSYLL